MDSQVLTTHPTGWAGGISTASEPDEWRRAPAAHCGRGLKVK